MNIFRMIKNTVNSKIRPTQYWFEYGFFPLPQYTDMSGYENLLDYIKEYKIYKLEGEIVEIGCFLGGGTYKLCKFYEKYSPQKKIYAVDIFNPDFDQVVNSEGITMKEYYNKQLAGFGGKSQMEIFKSITKDCNNLELITGDSLKITFPCSQISFAYIDGNHSSQHVVNDFYKVWNILTPDGAVALDDYGYDLPNVTETINEIIGKEAKFIRRIKTSGLKTIFITKI